MVLGAAIAMLGGVTVGVTVDDLGKTPSEPEASADGGTDMICST